MTLRGFLVKNRQHKQGHRLTPVAFAILVAALYVVITVGANAALLPDRANIITGSLPPTSPYRESLRHAKKGTEGLEVAAKLSFDSKIIQKPVTWNIRRYNADLGIPGETVFRGQVAIVDAVLPPGSYQIEAKYGYARILRTVAILPGTRLNATFIMNVGGIRVLSRVAGLDASHYAAAQHDIYALYDDKPDQLITSKIRQGQIVRLAAGDYRIESRFDNGNTLATANVTIKPGILTTMNIDHHAALAKLSFPFRGASKINWRILNPSGTPVQTGSSVNPKIILAPGRYTVVAKIGTQTQTRKVSLLQGKATIIIFGR